ncbi:MAG: phosphotransferase [Nitrospirae bacterium]|nr:phosphotransferase [Nitrospirota bacterium]
MARLYKYVNIGDYYFCLRQNPAVLAWILFFRGDDLLAIKPWLKRNYQKRNLRYYRGRFRSNLKTLIRFMQSRTKLPDAELVELPFYGQLSAPVHRGHKIFNFYRGTVTKIFDHDVNILSVISEIDRLRDISRIDFAPSLRKSNSDERWYEEDYVRGTVASLHRSADSGVFLSVFFHEAAPCIKRLISFRQPIMKDLRAYIEELRARLDINRFARKRPFPEVDSFADVIIGWLKNGPDLPVRLVFTHGDFCPANILNTKHGIRLVDWETAGPRSLLFDFFSYFFYRAPCGKLPVTQVAAEIAEALPRFLSGLSSGPPGISDGLSSQTGTYRRLFYLEYLSRLADRVLTDNRLNMADYIARYIDAFTRYERTLGANILTENSATSRAGI